MKNKQSQREVVLQQLRKEGFITRNYCLNRYISRLSDIIFKLKAENMNIEGKDLGNGDFIYRLLDKPKETIVYKVDNQIVGRKEIW